MAISPLFFFTFLALPSTINAFNITEILSQFKQYGGYNSILVDTGVAKKINSLVAVTVLVVSDDQLFYFNNLSKDVIKSILRFHVILDYYDESQLKSLKSRTSLATLNQEATMTVDHDSSGRVTFEPDGSSSDTGVKLLSTIESDPPSISVLQIASIILMNEAFDISSSPKQSPIASPPRKVLVPPLTSTPNAPSPSKTKPSNERPNASPLQPHDGSPIALPLQPDAQAPSSDQKSSAHARICYENCLDSIVMVLTAVWFIFIMT